VSGSGARVLVVDDERAIQRALKATLEAAGYHVDVVGTCADALAQVALKPPDLVLLDLLLPDGTGDEVAREIRTWSNVPILLVSAVGDEREKVKALDAGADDYVTKPFGIDELLARVRAALRRGGGETEMASFEAGEFRVDLEGRRVHARGNEVRLTPKEFELFVYMARHPNRVITHRTLLEAVWGEASQEQPEYLRVFMGQLRKKLEPDPSNPRFLVTEPWVGYRFNPNG
jgi:two-component system KDP operon response regulator KdpE